MAVDIETMPGLEAINMFSDGLIELMSEKLTPRVTPDSVLTPLGFNTHKTPLPAQHLRVEALAAQLLAPDERTALLQGDMGVGKTLMGLAVARLLSLRTPHRPYKVVIFCPPTLVDVWIDEIHDCLPAGTYAFADILEDNVPWALFNPGAIVFQIIPLTKLRQHYSTEVCAENPLMFSKNKGRQQRYHEVLKRLKNKSQYDQRIKHHIEDDDWGHKVEEKQARCPRCGHLFTKRNGQPMTIKDLERQASSQSKAITCPAPRFKKYWKSTWSLDEKEPVCGEVLVKPVPTKGRFDISKAYHAKKYRRNQVDLVISDEFHNIKNNGIQGKVGRWMSTVGKNFLALTGTLTGGYARDLFYLLWSISYRELRAEGYTYSMLTRFCNTYGSRERKEELVGSKAKTKPGKKAKKKTKVSYRPMAGISSAVYEKFLVAKSIFMSLEDLEKDLCPYTEHRVSLEMSSEMVRAFADVKNEFKTTIQAAHAAGFYRTQTLVSKYIHASMSWPDRLKEDQVQVTLEKQDEDGEIIDTLDVEINFDTVEIELTPKEKWLLNLVAQKKAEGRKVMAYYTYSNERDCGERIKSILDRAGFNVTLLTPSTVTAANRKKWIEEQTPNTDVLLCHPELVKEGLNLVEYPDIVFMQPDYNLYRLRQAARRSRRLNQTEAVHVYFVYYEDNTQEQAMSLIASKLDTALLAEGNPVDSELFEISYSPDSVFRGLINALTSGREDSLRLKCRNVEVLEEFDEDETPLTEPQMSVSEPVGGKVLVTIRKKSGRKKITVTEEVSIDNLEHGAQLAMF